MATLRAARPDDHARIHAVLDQWWGCRKMTALLPSLFLENFAQTSLVSEDAAGELIGFLIGFVSPDRSGEAYVHFVGVSPEHRGAGLGRDLHDRFAAIVASFGVTLVRCVTSTGNTESIAFHQEIGFIVDRVDSAIASDGVDDDHGHVCMSRHIAEATQPLFAPRSDPRPMDTEWTVAQWPVAMSTCLNGEFVTLTVSDPLTDAAELFAALDHDVVWAHVAGRPVDVRSMAALIQWKLDELSWCPWTVRLAKPLAGMAAGDVVGTTSFLEVVASDSRGEIGSTTYTPAVWAGPVNPECKLLLGSFGFDQLGWGRLQFKTDIRNSRSQIAIARLGATYEATLRRYQRRADNSVRDTVLFAFTAEQWPAAARRLRDRLSAYGDGA